MPSYGLRIVILTAGGVYFLSERCVGRTEGTKVIRVLGMTAALMTLAAVVLNIDLVYSARIFSSDRFCPSTWPAASGGVRRCIGSAVSVRHAAGWPIRATLMLKADAEVGRGAGIEPSGAQDEQRYAEVHDVESSQADVPEELHERPRTIIRRATTMSRCRSSTKAARWRVSTSCTWAAKAWSSFTARLPRRCWRPCVRIGGRRDRIPRLALGAAGALDSPPHGRRRGAPSDRHDFRTARISAVSFTPFSSKTSVKNQSLSIGAGAARGPRLAKPFIVAARCTAAVPHGTTNGRIRWRWS